MERLETAFFAGVLAGLVAHNLGVPWWRSWMAGDAADIAVLTGLLVHSYIGAMRAKVIVNNGAALAAGSRRAKTPKAVECEASQSGGEAVTPKE